MTCDLDTTFRFDRVLLDIIGDKWSIPVLGSIRDHGRHRRFNAIRRDVPGISQKSLTECLRRLERNGLIKRTVNTAAGSLAVNYTFTDLGNTLDAPVIAVLSWTASNSGAVRKAQAAYDVATRNTAPLDGHDGTFA
jgi:DNA-binding HxlR family transcriptional regulator